jgi:hypothetical protein
MQELLGKEQKAVTERGNEIFNENNSGEGKDDFEGKYFEESYNECKDLKTGNSDGHAENCSPEMHTIIGPPMEISSMIQSPHDLLQGSSKKRRISSKIRTAENVSSNSSEAFYNTDLLETSQSSSRTTTPLIQPSIHPIPCRRGKWGSEEWAYAQRLVQDFQAGLLPLENGTSLRTLLATALNCDPMRISKKFVGRDCIGEWCQHISCVPPAKWL